MCDWKAAVRTWERHEKEAGYQRPHGPRTQRPGDRCEDLSKYDAVPVEVLS
jgi:hypothetical protein